jgi:hypothetical protein
LSRRGLWSWPLAAACAALAGCVQLAWERDLRFEPVADEALQRLEVGATELGACLELFGAPLWVLEQPHTDGQGALLAYGWYASRNLGLRVSVPVSEYYSVSLDYDQIDARMQGLVLFFAPDWKLARWRTGLLRDLTREVLRPPVLVEDVEEPPAGAGP